MDAAAHPLCVIYPITFSLIYLVSAGRLRLIAYSTLLSVHVDLLLHGHIMPLFLYGTHPDLRAVWTTYIIIIIKYSIVCTYSLLYHFYLFAGTYYRFIGHGTGHSMTVFDLRSARPSHPAFCIAKALYRTLLFHAVVTFWMLIMWGFV